MSDLPAPPPERGDTLKPYVPKKRSFGDRVASVVLFLIPAMVLFAVLAAAIFVAVSPETTQDYSKPTPAVVAPYTDESVTALTEQVLGLVVSARSEAKPVWDAYVAKVRADGCLLMSKVEAAKSPSAAKPAITAFATTATRQAPATPAIGFAVQAVPTEKGVYWFAVAVSCP